MPNKILPHIYALDKYDIVLANGQFPGHAYLVELILNAENIICCDGSVNNLLQHSIEPDYIIGDCDSLAPEILLKYADRLTIISDQSSNDLSKALNFAKTQLGLKNIIILGATGLREDHAIANIAILAQYTNKFETLAMISDYGLFTAHTGTSRLKTIPGQQISFFSLVPENELNCNELKWPLVNLKIPAWNNGTLNEAISDSLTLTVTHLTITYRAFEFKARDLCVSR